MSGRKEERERLREERMAAQRAAQSSDKRRLYLGYAVAGLIVVALLAGLFVVITGGDSDEVGVDSEGNAFPELAYINEDVGQVPTGLEADGRAGTDPPEIETGVLADAAKLAGCQLQLDLEDQGNSHVGDAELSEVEYETNPPTSGDHSESPLADGAYREYAPPGNYLHAMEHGRVVIHYSPDLSEQEQLAIKGVFDESPSGMILIPNPEMKADVAVSAWTQLATCDSFEGSPTLGLLRVFSDIYRGQGPEAVPLNA